MENRCRFVIAAHWSKRERAGMSEILELVLEFVFNLAGCVLEAMADIWLGDLWPSTRAKRVFRCVAILFVVGVIWWELR
jgi:hypothetical protein